MALVREEAMKEEPAPPPPILGTWRLLYLVVVVNTVLVYGLLLLFSAFAR